MRVETLVVGQMATNCYIADGIIIDPGDDAEYIISHLKTDPTMIVATHGHFDHIMAACALQLAYNIPFVMHKEDAFLLDNMRSSAKHFLGLSTVDPPPKISKFIQDGEKIAGLTVVHTPGHTPGSISLAGDGVIFSGDTIFAGGAVGRTDFSYSEPVKLSESVRIILRRPAKTRLLSGHGEETTVENERSFHTI